MSPHSDDYDKANELQARDDFQGRRGLVAGWIVIFAIVGCVVIASLLASVLVGR